jgi:hypothetical protein
MEAARQPAKPEPRWRCVLSAGITAAVLLAGAFTAATLVFRLDLMWSGRGELQVFAVTLTTAFVAVLVPVLLLRLRFTLSFVYALMVAAICLLLAPVLLSAVVGIVAVIIDPTTLHVEMFYACVYAMAMAIFAAPGALAGAALGGCTRRG